MTPSVRPILGSRRSRRPLQREWILRVPPPLRCVRGHIPIAHARTPTSYPSIAHTTKSTQLHELRRPRHVPSIFATSRRMKNPISDLDFWRTLRALPRASGTTPGTSVRASVPCRKLLRVGPLQSGLSGKHHGRPGKLRRGLRITANLHCSPLAATTRCLRNAALIRSFLAT